MRPPSYVLSFSWQSMSRSSLGYKDDFEKKPSHIELVAVQASAGMVAGACSSVITTPIDTVKTRLQVIDDYGVGRPSVMKTAKSLVKEDGWGGFYRGFGPRFLNMSLYGTTMIVTYELIKIVLKARVIDKPAGALWEASAQHFIVIPQVEKKIEIDC
ncbi:hypothetical protein OROMI_027028 [Orobanche minor]